MKSTILVGVALIVLGSAVLVYDHFSYTTREQVVQIGPLSATTERTKTVWFPPVLGWLLVGAGTMVLIFSRPKK